MQDKTLKNETDYNIARGICTETVSQGRICGKRLIPTLKKDMKIILRAYLAAKTLETDSENGVLPPHFEWIADNFYILEEEFAATKKALPTQKNIQGGKGGLPRLYLAAKKYIRLIDRSLDEQALNSFIKAVDSDKSRRATIADLFSTEIFFRCALISYTADICSDLLSAKTNQIKSESNSQSFTRLLARVITSLKYISIHRFDDSFEECETEKILRRDPSGAYPKMTSETKAYYRELLSKNAKKLNISETEAALSALNSAQNAKNEYDRHIGAHLVDKPSGGSVYLLFLIILTLLLYAMSVYITPAALLLLFPIWEFVKSVLDFLFPYFYRATPLPRIKLSEIPDNAKVLCVITTLLSGEKNDKQIFDRLERIYHANRGKNIYFGVLCDLCDSETATLGSDSPIIQYAEDRINSLNSSCNNSFFLFIRHRVYSKSEKVFMAWERKRGAVIELVRYLKGKQTTFDLSVKSLSEKQKALSDIKYVITLDADTNLAIDSILEMAGAMLHPLNRPHIDNEKGIVTKGYGIMQPKAAPELSAASKTPFTRLMCGVGGIDIYSSASFDLYQTLFGEGIFCGKGIFDKDAFYEVIDRQNPLPEDLILSHDALEGARLRAALICDMELTDGFPKHELSFLKRNHRWIRGDLQNLCFLKKRVKGPNGEAVRNNINGISKFKLFDNIRRETFPIFSFIAIIAACFLNTRGAYLLILLSLMPYVVPFLLDSVSLLLTLAGQCAARRFFSKGVTTGIWQSFLRMLFFISMLAKNTLLTLDAIIRSTVRLLFTKQKLLEWVTAAQGDVGGKDTLLYFIQKNISSAVIGFLLFAFSPYGIIKIIGLMWFFLPMTAYFTSKDREKEKNAPTKQELSRLEAYALDIWRFFRECATEGDNYLPPDNLQLFPIENIAHRTSPTNIGLCLASILAARDFNFIDSHELYYRLENVLTTLDRMDKWNGHLYNWYDTESLGTLIPKYISTVDSGNLLACFITLKEGLLDYVSENVALLEIIRRVNRYIGEMDFSPLYNKKRDLFSLGIAFEKGEPVQSEGCYDLFMSEARILSYIASANRSVPKKHWFKLGRSLIRSGGYIGLSSWTGTAFEYFMPPLFLPIFKSSLSYEALLFALRAQRERRAGGRENGVWGISESGFFAFDSEMNYQYKAFGIPKLGLKRGLEKELVISPYSSMLTMCMSVKKSLVNLRRLYKNGLYGKYGFFEATDYTKSRTGGTPALVKSYMSHHLGMSLIALANARFGNIFVKRFMHNSAMSCGYELLEERIPVNAVIRDVKSKYDIPEKPARADRMTGKVFDDYSLLEPKVCALSDGRTTAMISDCGHLSLLNKKIAINSFSEERYETTRSLFSLMNIDGRAYCSTPILDINPEGSSYQFKYSSGFASHELTVKNPAFPKITSSAKYTISKNNLSAFRIKVDSSITETAAISEIETAFVFEPVLCEKESFEAHPSFSSLFIESAYDEEEKILFFKRRPRNDGEKEYHLAVAFFEKNLPFIFDTRKEDVFSPKLSQRDFADIFKKESKNNTGACVSPICLIKTKLSNISGHFSAELIIVGGKSKEELYGAIAGVRCESFDEASRSLSETTANLSLGAGLLPIYRDFSAGTPEERLLSAIFFKSCADDGAYMISLSFAKREASKNELWKHGISGDLPIVTINLGSALLSSQVEKYIRAFKLLFLKNLRFDLVILFSDREKYYRPSENSIFELISSCNADGYVKKHGGGIFPVETGKISDEGASIYAHSHLIINIFSEAEEKIENPPLKKVLLPVCSSDGYYKKDSKEKAEKTDLDVFGGSFTEDSFIVDKSYDIKLPFSHILTGKNFSTLVTQNSLGYSYYKNASERRVSAWDNDVIRDMNGERLLLFANNQCYDLAACAKTVTFSAGEAKYCGSVCELDYEISVFVPEKLTAKALSVTLTKKNRRYDNYRPDAYEDMRLCFLCEPVMGKSRSENGRISYLQNDGVILFKNRFSTSFSDYTGFLFGFTKINSEDAYLSTDKASVLTNRERFSGLSDCAAVTFDVNFYEQNSFNAYFSLGAYHDDQRVLGFIRKRFYDFFEEERKGAIAYSKSFMPEFSCSFSDSKNENTKNAIKHMFNFWLPYQNGACRFTARSGFYQSGGAYGYRDQLQDCITLMYSDKRAAKAHICRAATHQFKEGDALHWWHNIQDYSNLPKKGSLAGTPHHRGVRTRCSDDYLWLPYAACKYYSYTGEKDFWETKIRYVEGDPLSLEEQERYFEPIRSELTESLYLHCVRSIERALTLLGERGLPLIGGCDWSDGLNRIGKCGRGESVWLSMFLVVVLKKFSVICGILNDEERQRKYSEFAKTLSKNTENSCYDEKGERFIRGFYDDGTPFGDSDSDECKIDLLPQSFAAISDIEEDKHKPKTKKALYSAFNILYDKDNEILRLFYPPFANTKRDPGYIKGYVSGIRENGGQYTHAALWGALGFLRCAEMLNSNGNKKDAEDMISFAERVLLEVNPAIRMTKTAFGKELYKNYKTEPYAVAADIYSNPSHNGRGGWTWYTGAAGWYWRILLSEFFGLSLFSQSDNPYFELNTEKPYPLKNILDGASFTFEIPSAEGTAKYTIHYSLAKAPSLTLDGKKVTGNKIYSEKGEHKISVEIAG